MTSGPSGGPTYEMPEAATTNRNRWIALYVLCVGMLMIVLDVTVVNVALPSIRTDLGFSSSSLAWVVNAYLIAFGGLLLLAGRIGDLFGRRRVFVAGLAAFTAALIESTVASLSSTAVKSVTEPSGVGIRNEPPFNLPFNSGITSPIALAAPVVEGMMLTAAARARLKSLCGKSRMRWSLV